ncbi:ankyrin repeat domain-containing protein [uncultured Brachyspira sp.]|uniref:ankyrin repeat domain-containing protein n=1 Tax=uncultured Brachyspira sp. TaxID=221953 RepID=UPI0026342337|nr:ankyrin repeat domain-containing protein [uncultured Brachyspira sp.]
MIIKKILFIYLLLLIISSCKEKEKKEEEKINIRNISISSPENIYHTAYTNTVKIQGKYVDIGSSYYSLCGRKEGEYSKDYDIFEAIQNGSLKRVMELIDEGTDMQYDGEEEISNGIKSLYASGATPLIFAVFYRDLGIIKYLLDNKADPYICDNDGWNSFIWACSSGNIDAIKMLIEKYPDLINSKNRAGADGFLSAVSGGNTEVLEYLVKDLGMDMESVDEDGDGILYYADDDKIIEKLRELGADI